MPEDGVLARDLGQESLKLGVLHGIRLSGAHSAYKPSMLHPAHAAAGDREQLGHDFKLGLDAFRSTTFDATLRSVPPPVGPWRLPFNPAACENALDHMVLRWLELPRDEVSASPHREVLARQSRLVRGLHQEKR
jgi:hypothetical protein